MRFVARYSTVVLEHAAVRGGGVVAVVVDEHVPPATERRVVGGGVVDDLGRTEPAHELGVALTLIAASRSVFLLSPTLGESVHS